MFDALFIWIGEMLSVKYSFSELKEGYIDFLEEIGFDDHIVNLREGLLAGFSNFEFVIPLFFFVLFVCMALFGRRIFAILRFSALFVGGFIIGVFVLSESILAEFPDLPTWTIGLCIGIVAAVLSKPIFVCIYTLFFGYGSYFLVCGGPIPFLHKNFFVAALVAACVIFCIFYFRPYVEMGITAILGSYGVSCFISQILCFPQWGIFADGGEWIGILILTILFSVGAFAFQFNHRTRFQIR